jgi:hypothetical protein
MDKKEWEELKQDLQDPEYVEEFVTAAIKLALYGDKK